MIQSPTSTASKGSTCVVNMSELKDKDAHRCPLQKSQQQRMADAALRLAVGGNQERKERQKNPKSLFKIKLTAAETCSSGNEAASARRWRFGTTVDGRKNVKSAKPEQHHPCNKE